MKPSDLWPDPLQTAALWQAMVSVSAILAGALIFWWLIARAAGRTRRHYETLMVLAAQSRESESELATVQRRLTALRLVVNSIKYFLAISTLFLVLQQVGIRFDSLLLPAGFLGAAVGLGAQSLVRDVVSGLFLVFEGQFGVGDVVAINGTLGTIEEVGLRVTRLRDDSGQLFFFPNGGITSVSKYPQRTLPLLLWVPLASDADLQRADDIVREVLGAFDQHFTDTIGETRLLSSARDISVSSSATQADHTAMAEKVAYAAVDNAALTHTALANATTVFSQPVAIDWSCWQFTVHPARVSTLREKLPGRLLSAMQAAGIQTATGAAIEIVAAPAESTLKPA